MQVVIICMRSYLGALDNRQARDVRQRSRMPRQVVENLLLAEEDRRIIGVGCTRKLDAEQTPIDLVPDVLRWYVALREESEAKCDPRRLEVLARCAGSVLVAMLSMYI